MLRIIRELIEFEPKNTQTDIAQALKFLSGVLKKKAIVFLISDFISEAYEHNLKIVSKKHDITGVRIFDPREEKMPNVGLVPMVDAETKKVEWVNTSSATVRMAYEKYFREKTEEFQQVFTKCGAGQIQTRVDESYVTKLLGYFKSR